MNSKLQAQKGYQDNLNNRIEWLEMIAEENMSLKRRVEQLEKQIVETTKTNADLSHEIHQILGKMNHYSKLDDHKFIPSANILDSSFIQSTSASQEDIIKNINSLFKLTVINSRSHKELVDDIKTIRKALITHHLLEDDHFQNSNQKELTFSSETMIDIQGVKNSNMSTISHQSDNDHSKDYSHKVSKKKNNVCNYEDQNRNSNHKNNYQTDDVINCSQTKQIKQSQRIDSREQQKQIHNILEPKDINIYDNGKTTKIAHEAKLINYKTLQERENISSKTIDSSISKEKSHTLNSMNPLRSESSDNPNQVKQKQIMKVDFESTKKKIDDEINRRIKEENHKRQQTIGHSQEKVVKKGQSFDYTTSLSPQKLRERESVANKLVLERRIKEERISLYQGIANQTQNISFSTSKNPPPLPPSLNVTLQNR